MIVGRLISLLGAFFTRCERFFGAIPQPVWAVAAGVCAILILYFGGQPGSDLPLPRRLPPGSDKVLHFTAFAGLAACVFRAVFPPDPFRPPTPRNGAYLVVLIPALVGLIDEINQYFTPGRSSEFADIVADSLGGVFVLVFGLWYRRRLRARLGRGRKERRRR